MGAALIRGVSAAPPSVSAPLPPDLTSPDAVVSTSIASPPAPPKVVITRLTETVPASTSTAPAPAPVLTSVTTASPSPTKCPATPTRVISIRIPSIAVSSRDVISVPLNADGSLVTPPLSKVGELGWYCYSPVPGATGPSVVLAHDEQQGHHGLFWNLSQVKAGDDVVIDLSNGKTATFRVTQNMTVPKSEFGQYAKTVYGNTPNAQLRVITCSGLTSQEVVFADLVSLIPAAG